MLAKRLMNLSSFSLWGSLTPAERSSRITERALKHLGRVFSDSEARSRSSENSGLVFVGLDMVLASKKKALSSVCASAGKKDLKRTDEVAESESVSVTKKYLKKTESAVSENVSITKLFSSPDSISAESTPASKKDLQQLHGDLTEPELSSSSSEKLSIFTGSQVSASSNLPSSDFLVSGKLSDNAQNAQNGQFEHFVRMCADKGDADTIINFVGTLGRESGIKAYNVLIRVFLEKAMKSLNEEGSLQYMKAYQLFISMQEKGFPVEEDIYGLLLICSVHVLMEREFHLFKEYIEDGKGDPISILGYYEMLLCIFLENEDKIGELCSSVNVGAEDKGYGLAACVFRSMGRLSLEDKAQELIMALMKSEPAAEDISSFILEYACNIPNLEVKEVVSDFIYFHEELDVQPSVAVCEHLIMCCCGLLKVNEAYDVGDFMWEFDLNISDDIFRRMARASWKKYGFDLYNGDYKLSMAGYV